MIVVRNESPEKGFLWNHNWHTICILILVIKTVSCPPGSLGVYVMAICPGVLRMSVSISVNCLLFNDAWRTRFVTNPLTHRNLNPKFNEQERELLWLT